MARQKEFDRNEVLERAMCLFWERGYEATSIEDLVQATGINRASLYGTFGNKYELFTEALDRFQEREKAFVENVVRGSKSGIERIRRVFETRSQQTLADKRGCLLSNCTMELANRDPRIEERAHGGVEQWEKFFLENLTEAKRSGEISTDRDLVALARFLTATLLGLRFLAKTSPSCEMVKDVVETSLSVLS